MIDISGKYETLRTAVAEARLKVDPHTVKLLESDDLPKGDPYPIAKAAAALAAKKTSDLIPYCHPIPVDQVKLDVSIDGTYVTLSVYVKAIAKTGVEMEALTAASVAALTYYDMLKPVDDTLLIESIRLIEKTGGKSDFRDAISTPLKAAVLVLSDSVFNHKKEDKAGQAIIEALKSYPVKVEKHEILPDDQDKIRNTLMSLADFHRLDLVLTTGGTGLSKRDVTVEAAKSVIDREIPGVMEAARGFGQKRTPYAMLSRGVAGFRKDTLIVTLPGSSRGAQESMQALFPGLLHVFRIAKFNPQHNDGSRATKKKKGQHGRGRKD